jgi:hypothetical protein
MEQDTASNNHRSAVEVTAAPSGAAQARAGRVYVLNPAVAPAFWWNPIEGCQDEATAIRRADAFAAAISMRGVEDASFCMGKASDYLRAFFHAAALAREAEA